MTAVRHPVVCAWEYGRRRSTQVRYLKRNKGATGDTCRVPLIAGAALDCKANTLGNSLHLTEFYPLRTYSPASTQGPIRAHSSHSCQVQYVRPYRVRTSSF